MKSTLNPEEQLKSLNKLLEINSIINSVLDMGKLLNIIMETIKEIMNAEASTLFLYEDKNRELVFKVALGEAGRELEEKYRVKLGQGVAGWVAEKRKPVLINDVYKDERFDPNFDKKTGFISKSIVCVPLLFKGKLLGVIQAINPLKRKEFDENDLNLFCLFADQAVLAVQNAIFFQTALEEQRIKNEIISAQSFQKSLHPEISKRFGKISVAARSYSAREVGGEFYNIYRFNNESLGIALGDIHIKGVAGALNASIISGIVKGVTSTQNGNPSKIFPLLRNSLKENIKQSENVSFFYGLINPESNSIQFINAGFGYPILVRKNIARYLKFKSSSFDIKDHGTKRVIVKLEPGDFFIIITDGIVNIKNKGSQSMGLKRIMDHLSNNFSSPQEIVDSLIKLSEDFLNGLEQREDISVISLKVEG